jgi:hypothetical protein
MPLGDLIMKPDPALRNDSASSEVMTSWSPPPWALASVLDEHAVDHCRRVGQLRAESTNELIAVEIAQRDHMIVDVRGMTVERLPVFLRVGQELLTIEEAQTLVQVMALAFKLLDCSHATDQ